jgi:hypothetical protein
MKIIPLFTRLDKGGEKGGSLFALQSFSNHCHRLSATDKLTFSFMSHYYLIPADIAFILLSPFCRHYDSPFVPMLISHFHSGPSSLKPPGIVSDFFIRESLSLSFLLAMPAYTVKFDMVADNCIS